MSYRIMPPGSYIFWRIGMLSPLFRWVLTFSLCFSLIFLWYGIIMRSCLCISMHKKNLYASCATQLAELVENQKVSTTHAEDSSRQLSDPGLDILTLCDAQGIALQSLSCSKQTTRNTGGFKRVHVIFSGTGAHVCSVLNTLTEKNMSIKDVEVTFKKQSDQIYQCTLVYDSIV